MKPRYRVLYELDTRDGCTEALYDEASHSLSNKTSKLWNYFWLCSYWQVRLAGDISCKLQILPGFIQKTAIFYRTDETSTEGHIDQHTKACENTKGIRNPFDLRLLDRLTMDTPSTGQLEGQFLAVTKKRVPCEGPTGDQWVEQL